MNRTLRIEGAARTDAGLKRDHNEDNVLARPDLGLWAVADGMGGHVDGEWASACIIEELGRVEPHTDFDIQLVAVADAIHFANSRVFAEGTARGVNIGSTVVALLVDSERFGIVWAGDSRGYLLRNGTMHQLTTDHTHVQLLLEKGLVSAGEMHDHPMAHVLSRALGVAETVELDAITDSVVEGDRFLLCSDGLTAVAQDSDIAAILVSETLDAAADRMIERCLDRGAPDNVTVAVIDVRQSTLLIVGEAGDAT